MNLYEEICEGLGKANKRLKVDLILEELNEEDSAHLLMALKDADIPIRRIVSVLNRRGVSVSRDAVTTWRVRNQCHQSSEKS